MNTSTVTIMRATKEHIAGLISINCQLVKCEPIVDSIKLILHDCIGHRPVIPERHHQHMQRYLVHSSISHLNMLEKAVGPAFTFGEHLS